MTDFGMARNVGQDDIYTKKSRVKLQLNFALRKCFICYEQVPDVLVFFLRVFCNCLRTKGRLPVKWTAYEALLYGVYTTQSDV